MFGLESYDFVCHKDIDTSDLLGQYHKVDNGEFKWKDSGLVEAFKRGLFIIIHNPELVEKSIFDRLNAVFENERVLNVYEKGVSSNVKIHQNTRLVLISNNPYSLSPALLDRCVTVELSNKLNTLDIWKMFCKSQNELEKMVGRGLQDKEIKRTKSENVSAIEINDWILEDLINYKDLDILMRRFNVFGVRPTLINKDYTGVYNMLVEEDISALLAYQATPFSFDQEKIKYIKLYKKFIFDVPLGISDCEKVKILESCPAQEITQRTLCFLKNVGLSYVKDKSPRTLNDLKRECLKSIRDLSFKDYKQVRDVSERLGKINFTIDEDFDMSFFDMLANLTEDPLEIYKEFLKYEKKRHEDEFKKQIFSEIKKLYKYGEGNVEGLLKELKDLSKEFEDEIKGLEAKLPRDYDLFKTRIKQLDFVSYQKQIDEQLFFEKYSDVFNYYLLYLSKVDALPLNSSRGWYEFISSLSYPKVNVVEHCSYESIVVYFLKTKNLNVLQEIETSRIGVHLSKLLYSIMLGSVVVDPCSLVMEAIHSDHEFDFVEAKGLKFDESLLNECLLSVFNPKSVGYLIEQRKEICIESSIAESSLIESLPIDSTPIEVLNKLENDLSGNTNLISYELEDNLSLKLKDVNISDIHKDLKKLRDELTKYFKHSLSCTWLTNYRYFPFLFLNGLVDPERYFLDSLIYEFYDKINLAECLALKNNNNLFYNTVLQYKAFEIEKEVDKKIKDSQSKLRKDPKLFKKIHEDLKNYITLPVTKVLEIAFEKPVCGCSKEEVIGHPLSFLINGKEGCGCEEWLSLGDNYERSKIETQLVNLRETDRSTVLSTFYSREPSHKFINEEICLSKVINRITDDSTHLKLLSVALKHPLPAFLYFVFQFSEDKENVEYEDGTGIKGGTGEKNISDQIKEEEEISDEYDDQKGGEEEDGVDFDNQGSISTCDEDEASEAGVEESKEEEEEEGSTESKKEEESLEGDKDNNNEVDSIEENPENEILDEENESQEEGKEEAEGKEETEEIRENEDVSPLGVQNEYVFKEQQLNNNQTCSQAEDYDRKVFGENEDEETLCEGEGEQQTVGNDETGEAYGETPTINFNYKDSSSNKLTLLLRSIFESNRFNKYKGDYKSGKKLNMKKIIPYIASDYRKDKIWMKRRKSDKKDYVIRLFVDNSKSMYSQSMIDTLFVTFSRLTNSFKALGIPVEIYRFGNELVECSLQDMTFSDTETNIDWIDKFKDGVNIVLTDGVFQKTSFYNNNFLIILIDRSGIKKMSKVSLCDGNIFVEKYLDQFQLKYCTIESVEELENTFILALSELIKNN